MAEGEAEAACLAAVLLDDLPNAAHDERGTPSAWRQLFEAEHVDSAVYSGIHTACTTGRDWALRESPRLTMNLRAPSTDQGLQAWQARLAAGQHALRVRERKPTALTISCERGADCAAALRLVPAAFRDVGSGVRELSLTGYARGTEAADKDPQVITDFLREAAAMFTNLSSLYIDVRQDYVLPDTSSLPSLKSLAVGGFQPVPTLAPYLQQVTSLTFNEKDFPLTIFTRSSPTLQHTYTPELGPALVASLLSFAPAMREIECERLDRDIEKYPNLSTLQWGVTHVTAWSELDLNRAACLPYNDAQQPILLGGQRCTIGVGSLKKLQERLPAWRFVSQAVEISSNRSHTNYHLRMALGRLHDMQTSPSCIVYLDQWEMTPYVVQALHQNQPQLEHLRMGLKYYVLTTQLIATCLQLPSNCRNMYVNAIKLTSDEHANTPWPWEELTISSVDMTQLLYMPKPSSTSGGCVTVRFHVLDLKSVTEEHTGPLQEWLQHVTWEREDAYGNIEINLQDDGDKLSTHTNAQLSLLSTLQMSTKCKSYPPWRLREVATNGSFKSVSRNTISLTVNGSMTRLAVEALRALPAWVTEVCMGACEYPLSADVYKQLTRDMPLVAKGLAGKVAKAAA